MKLWLVLSLLYIAAAVAGASIEKDFEEFKARYNKRYANEEENHKRFKIFAANKNLVDRHNLKTSIGGGSHSFTLGINEYADLDPDEFRKHLLGTPIDAKPDNAVEDPADVVGLPEHVDWREKGYVTGVKNQGQCGSCWAFSAVGSVEAVHFGKSGKLVSLSERNLVDCVETNAGCQGGWMDLAFEYIIDNGGIDTEKSYPYLPEDGQCMFKAEEVGATLSGYKDVKSGSENALRRVTARVGPISVAIDAGHRTFSLYKNGTYFEEECSSTRLNHAVLVVGYGTDDAGGDYWLVKNSWGTSWGMEGYIKMARNKNNNCGIASNASYPIA